jgi:hypothetical protein
MLLGLLTNSNVTGALQMLQGLLTCCRWYSRVIGAIPEIQGLFRVPGDTQFVTGAKINRLQGLLTCYRDSTRVEVATHEV